MIVDLLALSYVEDKLWIWAYNTYRGPLKNQWPEHMARAIDAAEQVHRIYVKDYINAQRKRAEALARAIDIKRGVIYAH